MIKIRLRHTPDDRAALQFRTLGGVRIGLRTRYAAWDDRWYLSLVALDNAPIAGPMRIVPGVNFLEQWQYDPRVPAGTLFAYSFDGVPPTLLTVDTDAALYYLE